MTDNHPEYYSSHRTAMGSPRTGGTPGRTARFCAVLLLAASTLVHAAAPLPFQTSYDARYDDFSAQANRSLSQDPATGRFILQSKLELVLLGSVVTSITERSEFLWDAERPLPLQYSYVQQGIGARERSISFDHTAAQAQYKLNGTTGTMALTEPTFDELSGYLLLEARLAAGEMDISFNVVDRDQTKTVHYKVRNKERLATKLGEFDTIKLERIRDASSNRSTEIWLAPAHNYLMVKLVQEEPNGRVIRLDIREATIAGQVVSPTAPSSPSDPSDP